MFNDCRPREAIERYAGDDYIQHNPHLTTGKDASSPISSASRVSGRASGGGETGHRRKRSGCAACLQHWPGDDDYAGIDMFGSTGTGGTSSTGICCRSCPMFRKSERDVLSSERLAQTPRRSIIQDFRQAPLRSICNGLRLPRDYDRDSRPCPLFRSCPCLIRGPDPGSTAYPDSPWRDARRSTGRHFTLHLQRRTPVGRSSGR